MTVLDIKKMSRSGKLKLMESLWADLSQNEVDFESPEWHADALRETAERRARGEEPLLDWDEAKAKLRTKKASG